MPEKFRANDRERGGFRFWRKSSLQNKHRRSEHNPAKDIISQANDVVNKCIMQNETETYSSVVPRRKKIQAALFLTTSALVLAVLVYYLIH